MCCSKKPNELCKSGSISLRNYSVRDIPSCWILDALALRCFIFFLDLIYCSCFVQHFVCNFSFLCVNVYCVLKNLKIFSHGWNSEKRIITPFQHHIEFYIARKWKMVSTNVRKTFSANEWGKCTCTKSILQVIGFFSEYFSDYLGIW